jgi:hypothetical protein
VEGTYLGSLPVVATVVAREESAAAAPSVRGKVTLNRRRCMGSGQGQRRKAARRQRAQPGASVLTGEGPRGGAASSLSWAAAAAAFSLGCG